MSISTMVGLGMERQHEVSNPEASQATGEPAAGSGVQGALSKLTAFVPSEVVGLYIAGLGIVTPDTSYGKWCIFALCVILIPLFMVVSYLIQKKDDNKKNPTIGRWFILLIFALVAFVAWAAALPATPFLDLTPRATVFAGFAVLVLAAFMSKLAEALDISPMTS